MKQLISFLLFSFFLFTIQSTAQSLGIQGALRNSDGSAVPDGEYEIVFDFFSQATGGTSEHTVPSITADVSGGIYSVLLSSLPDPFNLRCAKKNKKDFLNL